MDKSEIQNVIDKGGYLISTYTEWPLIFKPNKVEIKIEVTGDTILPDTTFIDEKIVTTQNDGWREATPEEVKKHLHI